MPPTLSFTILLIITITSCDLLRQDSFDEPPTPGRRDYTWKVDTLSSSPGGFIYSIWGSSPNDVWAVLGGGTNPLWHYNGDVWTPWTKAVGPGTYSIFGFSSDDVWMGGNDGKVYHFNGEDWSTSFIYNKNGIYSADITDIWGYSPSNIYATGVLSYPDDKFHGFLLHYNGKHWSELLITESNVQLFRTRGDKSGLYLFGWDIHSIPNRLFLYSYSNRNLNNLLATTSDQVSIVSLNLIGNQIYFSIEDTIYNLRNKEFNKLLSVSIPDFNSHIYGRHKNDLFLCMDNGLAHYNGEDFEYLFTLNHSLLRLSNNSMIFEEDVFFIVQDYLTGSNLVYHGTLDDLEDIAN